MSENILEKIIKKKIEKIDKLKKHKQLNHWKKRLNKTMLSLILKIKLTITLLIIKSL